MQRTIANSVSCSGIALHSGSKVNITLKPSTQDSGIIFKRIDINDKDNIIRTNYDNVSKTNLGTVISNDDGVYVSTIEHFMAALWCLNISNLIIEIDSSEMPILDGSSEPFIFLLECAGFKNLEVVQKSIQITQEISVKIDDKFIIARPAENFTIDAKIDFKSDQILENHYYFDESKTSFKSDISRARTFCFKSEIDYMHSIGLAKGGSLDNAIVIDKDKIINEGALRYKDEFVKHKVLDFIGDLYLAGYRIVGTFETFKSGHDINNKFLRKLFSHPDSWKFV